MTPDHAEAPLLLGTSHDGERLRWDPTAGHLLLWALDNRRELGQFNAWLTSQARTRQWELIRIGRPAPGTSPHPRGSEAGRDRLVRRPLEQAHQLLRERLVEAAGPTAPALPLTVVVIDSHQDVVAAHDDTATTARDLAMVEDLTRLGRAAALTVVLRTTTPRPGDVAQENCSTRVAIANHELSRSGQTAMWGPRAGQVATPVVAHGAVLGLDRADNLAAFTAAWANHPTGPSHGQTGDPR